MLIMILYVFLFEILQIIAYKLIKHRVCFFTVIHLLASGPHRRQGHLKTPAAPLLRSSPDLDSARLFASFSCQAG